MDSLAQYISVVLTSSVKFIFGVLASIAAGFSLIEILVTTVGGGMLGVIVYMYLWEALVWIYRKVVPQKIKTIDGIRINKRLRLLVKVIQKYELYGVAFLTPPLLSVPGGVLIALAFEEDKWRIKRFMFISFLGWALFLSGLSSLLNIDVQAWLK
ncbi:MAG: hypothetical protein MUE96_09220 [Bacteroidia bacterium]|jgi:hypothetical protein|nr:hypothetical protein [Bacteroidia bacterium]